MTMGNSWSYVPNDQYKTADVIVKKLVDIVSKGGNYLLNIGPGPDGELDPVAYQRLAEIGNWIKINGEAIYGSRMFKVYGEGDSIRFTQSKDAHTQYIFLFSFPTNDITLTKIHFEKNAQLKLLGSTKKISWKSTGAGIVITVPEKLKAVSPYVWVLKVEQ